MDFGLIQRAFGLALAQALDRRFRRVLMIGLALTVALLIGAYALFLWLVSLTVGASLTLPLLGEVTWVGDLLGWAGLFLVLFLSVFLMVPVASAITSLFLEDVAEAVEARHYPQILPPPAISWGSALRDTVNFLGLLVAVNILALFLYPLVLWIPLGPVLLFWAVNGFLLGREFFVLVAMRHEGRRAALALRKQHRGTVWAAGVLMAMPLSVPLLNLFIPILGAATYTHIYHALRGTAGPMGARAGQDRPQG